MLVFEFKLKGKTEQFKRVDEAIRTGQFIRNSCLRYWQDNRGTTKNDLQKYCAVLASNPDFPWAKKLNSQARQAQADRAWSAISRFFENCKKVETPWQGVSTGKKGYPRFKKNSRSVEYKQTGWKLSEERKKLTLTDGFDAGSFKLVGSRDLNFYQPQQIKRIRIIKRADGYYAQFLIDVERSETPVYTGSQVGIDVGLASFYTDSNGQKVDNHRYLRQSERQLKRLSRTVARRYRNPNKGKKGAQMSKTKEKQSNRFHKARVHVARQNLGVSRQRKDFAVKTARNVIQSNDLVAYEDLKVRNLVKNHKLAKSISDASWSMFREWLEYFAKVFNKVVVAVPPHYTSADCSNCGTVVKKSLSVRTHSCPECKTVLDRDENAAINILLKAIELLGNTAGHAEIVVLAQRDVVQHGAIAANAHGQSDLCLIGESLSGKSSGKARKGKK